METERTSGVQMSEELNRVKTELTDTESQLQDKTKVREGMRERERGREGEGGEGRREKVVI